MIRDIIAENENMSPNSRELDILKEHFPSCFHSDGSFDLERFKEFLSDKIAVNNEGYELKFLGKNYARLLASMDTTTVIVPDEEHNAKPENIDSQNIYISGDNLDGLKHLLKSYSHKVKCIYIDPPYNTGKDDFAYNDSFNFTAEELAEKLSIDTEQATRILDITRKGSASHSAWLMFLYPRLLLARDLLTDDGVILTSIDDNEQANLKIMLDDIFGEENHVGTIIWKNVTDNNPTNITTEHEYIVCYCKRKNGLTNEWKSPYSDLKATVLKKEKELLGEYGEDADAIQRNYSLWYAAHKTQLGKLDGYKFCDCGGVYAGSRSVHNPGKQGYFYDVIHPITNKPCTPPLMGYRFPETTMHNLINDGKILFGEDETKIIELKQYLHDYEDKLSSVLSLDGRSGANIIRSLFNSKNVFKNPKTPYVLEEIFPYILDENDIVLDFFAGSSTTAHALMDLNASYHKKWKYILIQWKEHVKDGSDAANAGFETIDQIGIERIKRSANQIREERDSTTDDLGFRHFTLQEPSGATLDKLLKFTPEDNGMFSSDLVNEFGIPTVLTTWLVRDGYGFTDAAQFIDFAGYTAYYKDKHLYLIDQNLTNEVITAIVDKYETDGDFNPENVVLFGYSFTWSEMDSLKVNLARLKDTEKNLRINFDVRY